MTQFRKLNKTGTKLITCAGALALMAGAGMAPTAYAYDCLLDTNNDGDADSNVDTDGGANSGGFSNPLACGSFASATGSEAIALGGSANAAGFHSTALGFSASAAGGNSTALGTSGSAAGNDSIVIGANAEDGGFAEAIVIGTGASASANRTTAVGTGANAAGSDSIAVGYGTNFLTTSGGNSIALGEFARSRGSNSIAIGSDTVDAGLIGASAGGNNSIVIGTDASDSFKVGAIVIGTGVSATEVDQVILKSADTFTILGNGDVGMGTAAPAGNLDIDSGGAVDTTLLLSNTVAQWEFKSKATTGRLNFKNLIAGGVPFKLGPSAVNSLLSVGTMADDLVEVRGELMVEGDVDVTGTLTTGGPTCGGGCDAVFGANYDLPSIEEHAAAMYANSYLPEIGPTVPKAAINVTERMGTMLNELEKAHIYIAQQQKELTEIKQQLALLMTQ